MKSLINHCLSETARRSESAKSDASGQPPAARSLRAFSPERADDVMDRLWQNMSAVYGHRWASAYGLPGDEPSLIWRRALGDCTLEQIRRGLDACLSRPDPWPPTLPEFLALCAPPPPPPYHREWKPPGPLLPMSAEARAAAIAKRKATAAAEIAKIREVLNMPKRG